jgi:hypothetical protein
MNLIEFINYAKNNVPGITYYPGIIQKDIREEALKFQGYISF